MSSYYLNNYGPLLENLVVTLQPRTIVEFGILDGYSLDHFVKGGQRLSLQPCIHAFDLFDDYEYKHADAGRLWRRFGSMIRHGNFYSPDLRASLRDIDILHIDISNTGDTYQFAIDNWLPKVSEGGLMILEGGSKDRDEIEWMVKYDKPKIRPVLEASGLNYLTLDPYPSMTIIRK